MSQNKFKNNSFIFHFVKHDYQYSSFNLLLPKSKFFLLNKHYYSIFARLTNRGSVDNPTFEAKG